MRSAHDPRPAVDCGAVEIVVATLDGARVNAAAHAQGKIVGSTGIGDCTLQREGCTDRVEGIIKSGVNAVACRLDDHAAVRLHRSARDCVMSRQCLAHPLGFVLPEPGAAFDVGEEKRRERTGIVHAGNAESPRKELLYGSSKRCTSGALHRIAFA